MAQAPKKKYKLPKDLSSLSDHDLMERIFGKRIMKEVDNLVIENSEVVENKHNKLNIKER